MTVNMKRLLEKMFLNSTLAERTNKAVKDALIAPAHELGLELNDADFESATDNRMSNNKLELITGTTPVRAQLAVAEYQMKSATDVLDRGT